MVSRRPETQAAFPLHTTHRDPMVAVMAANSNHYMLPPMAGVLQNYVPADYEENGRLYHGYKKGIYMYPCDEGEKDRMDIFHKFFLVARREALHSARLMPNYDTLRILDLGTGTGIWAIDMADKYPEAEVTGFDISLIQPFKIPPNIQFRRRDIEAPWIGLPMDNWDMIHLRMMAGSISSWPELYANVFRHLKPVFGSIEQVELDIYPRCDDGSLPPNAALFQWANLLLSATEQAGRPLAYNRNTRQMLEQAGFTEVTEQVIKVPFNMWPADPHLQDIGTWYYLGLVEYLQALTLGPLFRVYGWPKEKIMALLVDVEKEIRTRKYHVYCEMHIWTGRRPA